MANTTKPVIKKPAAKKEAAKQPAIKSSAIKKTTAKKPAAKKLAENIGGMDPDLGGVDLDAGGVQPGVMLGADIYPNPSFRVKNWKTTWVGPRGFTWHWKKLTWAAERSRRFGRSTPRRRGGSGSLCDVVSEFLGLARSATEFSLCFCMHPCVICMRV